LSKILEITDLLRKDKNLVDLFTYNSMTKDVEFRKKPPWVADKKLNENDLIQLKYYLAYTHNAEYSKQLLEEGVVVIAQERPYHPLLNYLDKLKWDGAERLDYWLIKICGAVDNVYTREAGRKTICGAIKRAYEPGCKFDYMLLLEGEQGIGKSTLINILAGQWYLDTSLNTNEDKKEIVDQMRTAWIIEISDLAGFRKSDVEHLKHFLSDQSDRVRMPYAHRAEDFPRQCIFIGTHNPSGNNEYFKDDTGNRRFWPVECTRIDLGLMREWRDQLFAEAIVRYKAGEEIYISNKESLAVLSDLHESREVVTPLNEMIDEYIVDKNFVNAREVIRLVFGLDPGRMTFTELRSKCTVIGIYMKKLRWVHGKNKKRGWYFRPGHEYDDITSVAGELFKKDEGWSDG